MYESLVCIMNLGKMYNFACLHGKPRKDVQGLHAYSSCFTQACLVSVFHYSIGRFSTLHFVGHVF